MTITSETEKINENTYVVSTYIIEINEPAILQTRTILVNGVRCDYQGEPGFVIYYPNGNEWKEFNLDKGDLLKMTEYSEKGIKILEETYKDQVLHSYEKEPSRVVYRTDGTKYSDEWHISGLYHGVGKLIYTSNGKMNIGTFYYDCGQLVEAISNYLGRKIHIQNNIITRVE